MENREEVDNAVSNKPVLEERLPKSAIIPDGAVVLGGAVFNSWRWDLRSYAKVKAHRTNYDLKFLSRFGEEICYGPMYGAVISVMEYCYARLNNPLETDTALNPATISNNISSFKRLLQWMDGCAIYSFQEFGCDEFTKFQNWLRIECVNDCISAESAGALIGVINKYHEYNKRVSDRLVCNPFDGKNARWLGFVDATDNDGNKTQPIPTEVMSPLLRYALDMIHHYADDILRAREFIFNTKEEVLSEIKNSGIEYKDHAIKKRVSGAVKSMLQALPISNDPSTQRPWRGSWDSYSDWRRSEAALMNACLTVVFFLSGMRESEVISLKLGCAYKDISSDGVIEEYFVNSRLIKNNDRQEVWIIVRPAYDALIMAEKVASPLSKVTKCNSLFMSTPSGYSYGGSLGCKEFVYESIVSNSKTDEFEFGHNVVNTRLNSFVNYLNTQFDKSSEVIPKVGGKRWKLSSSQFRRTLARYIARQPFGIIAGTIQYKHAHTSIFEGYAGNDPTWKNMLEEERALASIDHLRDLYFDLEDGTVAGVKGEQLVAEHEKIFNDFKGTAGDRRSDGLSYWLDNMRGNFHVGNLNYCFYDPDYAMCNKNSETAQGDRPVLNRCHPDKCPNSCVTKEHAPIWQAQYSDADDLLQNHKLSEPQRISLEYDRDVAKKILKKIAIEIV